MGIPKNITKEHIAKAIDEINPLEIPKSRNSNTYFLHSEGKILPPKFVLGEANKHANNEVLDSDVFNAVEAVGYLEKLGYQIEKSHDIIGIKQKFLMFMKRFHKNSSTSKEYIKMMPKIEKWFINNDIVDKDFNIWKDIEQIPIIENSLVSVEKENWRKKNKNEHNWYGSPWNMWVRFNNDKSSEDYPSEEIELLDFDTNQFVNDVFSSGLVYGKRLISRFLASLITKPFVILTGLSGAGKTKLAQAFVQWICQDESQYRIIPVGADWTNREPLLGYPNALNPEEYVKPDSDVLDLIIRANKNHDLPHFLILDEMNLSHVERYFADFLSVMESRQSIPLYANDSTKNGAPPNLNLPSNLFIIGTVNIDETTNMFSPKVLDRANTIEFRVTANEMEIFLNTIGPVNLDVLTTKGAGMAKSFLELAEKKEFNSSDSEHINETLVRFFGELKKSGAEFGYRSATEIIRLIDQLTIVDGGLDINEKLDIAIMQKLLPKLHGSRRKLCPVLETLASFCIESDLNTVQDIFKKEDFDFNSAAVRYPLSLEKISRMYKGAIDNGFASYAEA